MKKLLLTALSTVMLTATATYASDAVGSGFGTLTTAKTIGMGVGFIGGGVGIADATSGFGTFTYGLSAHTDGQLKLGIIDDSHVDASIDLGATFKYQFIDANVNGPFDMAAGGFFEYYHPKSNDIGFSIVSIGAQYLGSYPLKMANGSTLSPYGRFNIRLERVNPDFTGATSQTNLQLGLNGGVQWQVNKDINLYGEFQLDGNDGLFFGIDFRTM